MMYALNDLTNNFLNAESIFTGMHVLECWFTYFHEWIVCVRFQFESRV